MTRQASPVDLAPSELQEEKDDQDELLLVSSFNGWVNWVVQRLRVRSQ